MEYEFSSALNKYYYIRRTPPTLLKLRFKSFVGLGIIVCVNNVLFVSVEESKLLFKRLCTLEMLAVGKCESYFEIID